MADARVVEGAIFAIGASANLAIAIPISYSNY